MAPVQRTVLLCGDSPYLLETLSGLALDDGWVPRLAKSLDGLPDKLAAAPADRSVVVVDLSVKGVDPERVLATVRAQPRPLPLVGVLPPGMPPEQLAELEQAGFAWLFEASTPSHEILYGLKSLLAPPPPEHRKERRAPADFEVEFWAAQEQPRRGVIRDLNVGGMFIETEQRYMLGDEVTVRFALTDPPVRIEAQAEVVFSSPKLDRSSSLLPGNGIKFRDLDPAAVEAIGAYVARILKRMPGTSGRALIGIRSSRS